MYKLITPVLPIARGAKLCVAKKPSKAKQMEVVAHRQIITRKSQYGFPSSIISIIDHHT